VPTYSYRCTECDTAFDIQQAFTDDTLTDCPSCGGKLRKVFSSIGVTFSGSGFYSNDARSDAKRSLERSAKTTDNKSETKSGEKSDTKSAEKSSPAPAMASAAPAKISGGTSATAPAAKSS